MAQWLAASCMLVLLSASCVSKPDGKTAAIVQTIDEFHRPESVAFSLDGKTLFVGNCGSDLFGPDRKFVGMVKGNGAISKLSIDASGRASISDLTFIEGLNSPLGLGVLPIATERFPKGTLLVNQGNTLLVDEQGQPVTDARDLGTGVIFF